MRVNTGGVKVLLFVAAGLIFFAVRHAKSSGGDMKYPIIMGSIAAAILLSVIGYYLARYMKGSMKLELNQKRVISGNLIQGKLNVVTKKSIHADRMYIALVGEREEWSRSSSSSSSGRSKQWVEFYRDESDILLGQQLHAGFRESYDFEFNAPSEAQVMGGGQVLKTAGDQMDDGVAKALVQGLGSLASLGGGKKRWRVISRLETKGVDLAASQALHVSLKQL